MKAIVTERDGTSSRLVLRDVPEPTPGPTEVLVQVHAAAMNQADLRRAVSHFSSSERSSEVSIGGLEMAGTVIGLGSEVHGVAMDDPVMAMTGRSWAEQATVDHRLAIAVPSALSWREAAATPVSFVTAYDALVNAAQATSSDVVLVQGATSAAGLACIQLARSLGVKSIIGTTRSAAKGELLAAFGCDAVLVRGRDDIPEGVATLTEGRGADVIIDIVGGSVLQENVNCAAILGRVVCLGRVGGTEGTVNIDEFSRKRITMRGVTFRTRTLEERIAATDRFSSNVLPELAAGRIRPFYGKTFAMEHVPEAERYISTGEQFGKVVVDVMPTS
jgi:NADPH2:quinone reductase